MLFLYLLLAASVVEARQVLADSTPNPAAAQFRNVEVRGDVVCGEINRPNRLGGYEGFAGFVYRDRNSWALITNDGSSVLREGTTVTSTAELTEGSERLEVGLRALGLYVLCARR